MSRLTWIVPALLGAIVLASCRVMAQGDTAAIIRMADDVRFTPHDSRTADGRWCLGRVGRIDADSLIIASSPGCAAGALSNAERTGLQVMRGDRGSRLGHFAIGLVTGALVGGVGGMLLAPNDCPTSSCWFRGLDVVLYGTVGALGGMAAGAVTGFVWPSGPTWLPVVETRTVRLGGLSLRPALGVAFASYR